MKVIMDTQGQPTSSVAAIPDPPERRRAVRQAYDTTGWVSGEAGNGNRQISKTVNVFDLSLYGAGFISDVKYETDAVHWMVLGGGALRASSRIRIVSCRLRDDGRYDCGAEFF
ncbi:MAG: hypothetical protein ABSF29_02365 [Tepidisphaeraceae bacterium]|jgi:hypothetical protein